MEGKKKQAGGEVRSYEYSAISGHHDTSYIVIVQMRCSDYFQEEFVDWVKLLESTLGDPRP